MMVGKVRNMYETKTERLKKICKYCYCLLLLMFVACMMIMSGCIILYIIIFTYPALIAEESIPAMFQMLTDVIVMTVIMTVSTYCIMRIAKSISTDYSPFTLTNVRYLKIMAVTMMIMFFVHITVQTVFMMLEKYPEGYVLNVPLSYIFGSVLLYSLSLIFQYGVVLQKESDETL